jgi:putative oxidoreductase
MNKNAEIGALILRVVLGITFFLHGFSKFQGGIDNTVGFFSSMGIPGFMAYVVAVIEVVGGMAVILGLGTRIISALLAFIMLGAILIVKLSSGFMGGYELDVVLLAMAIYLFLNGSSLLSIDTKLPVPASLKSVFKAN